MSDRVRIVLIVVVMAAVIGVSYWYMQVTTGTVVVEAEKKWRLRDHLLGVAFADAATGWAVGQYGTVLHTVDGGKSWTYQKSGSKQDLLGVYAVSPDNVWAVGQQCTVLHTADAGQNWQPVATLPKSKSLYNDVQFVSPQEGWIVGEFEIILHTTDGGTSWQKVHGGEPEPIDFSQIDENEVLPDDFGMEEEVYTLNSVYFLNAQLGWTVGEAGVILHTGDGGQTWVRQKSGIGNSLMDVEFVTPEFGITVGLDSLIMKSRDGGQTWTREEPTIKTHYYGVTFRRYGPEVVRYDAFAVGQGVVAYYSYLKKEYLQNWMPAADMKYDVTYTWLSKIVFISKTGEEGITVGQDGLILRTPSGGHEWNKIDYPEKTVALVMSP